MARYSPRDPGYTRSPSILEGLASVARSGAAGHRAVKLEEERQEERDLARELRDVELHSRGYKRGRAPREEIPEEEDVARGSGFGMQNERTEAAPPIFQGARPGMAAGTGGLDASLGAIERQGIPPEPEIMALPGSYVEGMGFTPRAITDQDLVAHTRAGAGPRTRARPGTEQVTDDIYFDESASPGGRERAAAAAESQAESARAREERARLEAGLAAVQEGRELTPSEQADLLGEVPGSVLFGEEGEDTIRVGGRDFPNTPAGEAAALAWESELSDARGRPSTDPGVTNEVTRRQLATMALRAIQDVQDEWRELTDYQRERRTAAGQGVDDSVQEILDLFDFGSMGALQTEIAALRGRGGGQPPRGAGRGGGSTPPPSGGGDQIPDEVLLDLLERYPDATDEEILELARQGR